jgi:hypothetical protein
MCWIPRECCSRTTNLAMPRDPSRVQAMWELMQTCHDKCATVVNTGSEVFLNLTPYSLVDGYQCFGGKLKQRNGGNHLLDCMVSLLRRLQPWTIWQYLQTAKKLDICKTQKQDCKKSFWHRRQNVVWQCVAFLAINMTMINKWPLGRLSRRWGHTSEREICKRQQGNSGHRDTRVWIKMNGKGHVKLFSAL